MKALGLGRLVKFDFFDSPPVETLMRAYEQLILLEAIEETGEISALGKVMSLLPLDPHLSKMLMSSCRLIGGQYPIWFNSMFEFYPKMIHSIFDLPKKQFKILFNSKKNLLIQFKRYFNSIQGIIILVKKGKVPKNCPKSVQNKQKF